MPYNIRNNIWFDMIEALNIFLERIQKSTTLSELDLEQAKFLGKHGVLTNELKKINCLPIDEKKVIGKKLNEIKNKAEIAIAAQMQIIKTKELNKKLSEESLDMTLPVENKFGKLHILTREINRIKQQYQSFGYLILDGPEIETEFYNFDALNIPKHHPARQNQDTFYLKNFPSYLLRTQTSCVQIRAIQKYGLPLKMLSIGKTYRNDPLDATHSPMFYQIEGLVVSYNPINLQHLKYALEQFVSFVFEIENLKIRLRPSYFPFTEPGLEVDYSYDTNGEFKWLEIGGAGMVHPNVFKACGIDKTAYGFAFGIGLDRLIMLKYNIHDIRQIYDTDARFLNAI